MVHILLMILKIIGIVLLSVIGIILLLVLAVLFVPVRYYASSDYHGHFKGKLHVGWLLNILRVDASYEKAADMKVKALFFTLYDNSKNNNADDNTYYSADDVYNQNSSDKKTVHPKEKNVFDEKTEESVYTTDVSSMEAGKKAEKKAENKKNAEKKVENKTEKKTGNTDIHSGKNIGIAEKKDNKQPEKESKQQELHQNSKIHHKPKQHSAKSFFLELISKAKNMLKKIKIKAESVVKNKNKLEAKINKIKAVVEDEANKEMVSLLYKQFKSFLCEIKPVKYDINIHYGCEDPYITGEILAYASIFYGLSGFKANINPDFDNKIIEGDIFIKGRIRVYKLLLIGLHVYRNDRFRKLVMKR